MVSLNRFFTVDRIDKYRAQKVKILLRVPVGGEMYLDKSLRKYIYDIDNVQNILDGDMLGRTWEMTSKGLSCVDCDGSEASLDGRGMEFSIDDEGNDSHIRIDESGVHISGPDGEKVAIDSNGIIIHDEKRDRVKIIARPAGSAPQKPTPPSTPLFP